MLRLPSGCLSKLLLRILEASGLRSYVSRKTLILQAQVKIGSPMAKAFRLLGNGERVSAPMQLVLSWILRLLLMSS